MRQAGYFCARLAIQSIGRTKVALEQVKTTDDLSPEEVMRTREFRLGFEDVRAGRPARFDMCNDTNRAWNYERGRQFATIAPLSMKLRINGELNSRAVRLFVAADCRGDIL